MSYNNESWVRPDDITAWLREAGHDEVALLEVDSKRYVGAQIGIHDPAGRKVGTVSHLRNTEYVFVAGSRHAVTAATRIGACAYRLSGVGAVSSGANFVARRHAFETEP